MKSQFVALAIVLAGLPALAWGQGSCGCTSRAPVRSSVPASYGAWADYQPEGYRGGGCGSCGSCTSCAPTCCTPCCGRQLLCIIPNTVRKIGNVLDCILPCGPRNCGGCSSCTASVGCASGCPSCSSPAGMGNPFQDDEVLPPMPPKPKAQDTRRQPTMRTQREYAAAPQMSPKMANSRPATKSILTRAPQQASEEVSRANHTDTPAKKTVSVVKRTSATVSISDTSETQSSRRAAAAIPHNPLR